MALTSSARTRIINPRLGIYFGIFTSAFVALALVLTIFEQLGADDGTLGFLMLAGPLVLYIAIGVAAFTREPIDFFAAGRRVPAFYTGLNLAVSALGATGIMALTGALFFAGFDALCLGLGFVAGFVVIAVLVAPYMRKAGAFTLPSYFSRRYESRLVRLTSAAIVAVPMVLVLAAEIRAGAFAASFLSGANIEIMAVCLVLVLIGILVAGGLRSLTWAGTGASIAALLTLLVPVAIVAVFLTNMPVPQLSHGPVLRALGRSENALEMSRSTVDLLTFALAGEGLQPVVHRFATPNGSVGALAFIIAMLTTAAGIAAAPWLLPRLAATPSVYETRKSLGWATILSGVVIVTLASIAVFMREYLFDIVTAAGSAQIPAWLQDLSGSDLAQIDTGTGAFSVSSFSFVRDGIILGLPLAGGMPGVMLHVVLAGLVAASIVGAGASIVALGNVLAEDVVDGLSPTAAPDNIRLGTGRITLMVVAAIGCAFAILAPTDPLRLVIWALVLTASSIFPVLILSIWWKRSNAYGALAGMITGFAVAALAMLASEAHWLGLDSALAGVFGLPAGLAAAMIVTVMTPLPGRDALDLVSDMRIPGGETLYDREMRLQRQRLRQHG
ncbi:MAG: sodium:solute symporter [Hyphomicrobiaceae bacterium]|jgi:cation/acetate symporter|nr:sodium:solute symporter [Hyphomicrobiaceae bacterium]